MATNRNTISTANNAVKTWLKGKGQVEAKNNKQQQRLNVLIKDSTNTNLKNENVVIINKNNIKNNTLTTT